MCKAEDRRPPRFVALQSLPDHVAEAAQALGRVQPEAQAASALNHSNIGTIHEVDDRHGQVFIAMSFCTGTAAYYHPGQKKSCTRANESRSNAR